METNTVTNIVYSVVTNLQTQLDYSLITKVNTFYDSAWSKLLWVLGFFGIGLPIIVSFLQKQASDREKEAIDTIIRTAVDEGKRTAHDDIEKLVNEVKLQLSLQMQTELNVHKNSLKETVTEIEKVRDVILKNDACVHANIRVLQVKKCLDEKNIQLATNAALDAAAFFLLADRFDDSEFIFKKHLMLMLPCIVNEDIEKHPTIRSSLDILIKAVDDADAPEQIKKYESWLKQQLEEIPNRKRNG
jgi:hypothetical protein